MPASLRTGVDRDRDGAHQRISLRSTTRLQSSQSGVWLDTGKIFQTVAAGVAALRQDETKGSPIRQAAGGGVR